MLKSTDFIREFPIKTKTDRDVEIPLLVEYVSKHKPESLLDVGAHWSHAYYAKEIRPFIKKYDAVDILPDEQTKAIVDNYYVGNSLSLPLTQYDMVICVSSIEHSGLSTYKIPEEDLKLERSLVFTNILERFYKKCFFSFPVGLEYPNPTEMMPITKEELDSFSYVMDYRKIKHQERFFYNKSVTDGFPWQEHTKRDVALKIPYIDFIGTQSLCVLTAEKV